MRAHARPEKGPLAHPLRPFHSREALLAVRLAALFPSAIGTPSQLGLEHFRKAYLLGASERRETSGAERNLGKSDREQEKVFVSNEARRGERTVFLPRNCVVRAIVCAKAN